MDLRSAVARAPTNHGRLTYFVGLLLKGGVDRHPVAVGQTVGLVRHPDHRHQLAEHRFRHACLARDPALLKRTWESVKEVMQPGALDALTKEIIYVAVSVTNGCNYCIASHTAGARKAGMTDAMFGELMAVVGMANETNRLANGYRVPVDAAFEQ